jgi:M-phase inducer tyrosine phosphatase
MSIRTIQFVQGTHDNVEDVLSSDLELSFASAMSLNSPLRTSTKLVDTVCREDVIPMDISPEPSRFVQPSRMTSSHLVGKVMRACGSTTSVRLFGRNLSNEVPIPPGAASLGPGAAAPNRVCVVSPGCPFCS